MARDLPARTVLTGPQTAANGRDARGRFVAGAPLGPGRPAVANPFARYQAELRAALLAEVSPADLRTVLRQVLKIAKRGHLPAVELLLKWVLGAPPLPVDPDRLDEHELSVKRGKPTLIDQLALAEPPAGDADDPAAEAPAEDAPEDADPLNPSLRQTLNWAVEELAQAQYALRMQRPPPPDPMAGWGRFAESRLEFDPQAAVEGDHLYLSYARWCASHGELVLEEAQVLAWLTDHRAGVRTGTLSQTALVVGVRVTA
jgi:hypothetical protein